MIEPFNWPTVCSRRYPDEGRGEGVLAENIKENDILILIQGAGERSLIITLL